MTAADLRDHAVACPDPACRDAVVWDVWLRLSSAEERAGEQRDAAARAVAQGAALARGVADLLAATRGRKTIPRDRLAAAVRAAGDATA